ncbi:RNA polymerase subunit sigma-70 [Paenibacillus sp. FSL H8-0548]|uniref:sigma-70 family RNA polymerase sigma factor n=1 Tax=Paenibacillus sp. FSL H8-0548 TaxID=1920422 RepID=UPI00096CD6E0|nr:sigma-70 family RNA polymerase sigma factor [Paenibacillus sp. FSL H8-0548]OMF24133.1 RNA polymerase subunit sigma-70 [Paenibacillus sp. FSL H8-0548]
MKFNDKNVIQQLQRRNEDALEYIIDTYLPLIKGVIHKVLSPLENEGMIDECINDTFLSIWSHSKKFHGEATDFKKWICAIAKYKAIDYYRKAAKNVEFTSNDIVWNTEKSAEDELILMEDKSELIKIINQLEPVDRNIFIMKFFLGFRTEDIAAKLGLSNTAIDNRIYRGKKKLYSKAVHLNFGGSVR